MIPDKDRSIYNDFSAKDESEWKFDTYEDYLFFCEENRLTNPQSKEDYEASKQPGFKFVPPPVSALLVLLFYVMVKLL